MACCGKRRSSEAGARRRAPCAPACRAVQKALRPWVPHAYAALLMLALPVLVYGLVPLPRLRVAYYVVSACFGFVALWVLLETLMAIGATIGLLAMTKCAARPCALNVRLFTAPAAPPTRAPARITSACRACSDCAPLTWAWCTWQLVLAQRASTELRAHKPSTCHCMLRAEASNTVACRTQHPLMCCACACTLRSCCLRSWRNVSCSANASIVPWRADFTWPLIRAGSGQR